jgi:guanine deaminase
MPGSLKNVNTISMKREERFMMEAIELSEKGMENNEGGPFGCIVVKNGVVIGRGNNKVMLTHDPTAHAEIIAIRDACKNIGSFQLDGCEIYTSCEPCPMCLGAIYWARPDVVYYANTCHDAAAIGFDDAMIYKEMEIALTDRKIPVKNLCRPQALKIFERWSKKQNKNLY